MKRPPWYRPAIGAMWFAAAIAAMATFSHARVLVSGGGGGGGVVTDPVIPADGTLNVTGSLEVAGKIASPYQSVTLGAAAATFAITRDNVLLTGDAGTNTVTTITGGVDGQDIRVQFVDALVTVTDDNSGTANTINLNAAFTGAANVVLSLTSNGTSWREVTRSTSGSGAHPAGTTLALNDNICIALGTGGDAEICYDGSDMTVNPKAVGVGIVSVLGSLDVDGDWTQSGGTTTLIGDVGMTGDVTVTGQNGQPDVGVTLGAAATALAITRDFTKVTGDAGSNTVATITGGIDGELITLLFVDALVTVTDTDTHAADSVSLESTFTSAAHSTLTLRYDGASWHEFSRTPVPGGSFDGDLAGNELQDTTDGYVTIDSGDHWEWSGSTKIKLVSDGNIAITNSAESAVATSIRLGTDAVQDVEICNKNLAKIEFRAADGTCTGASTGVLGSNFTVDVGGVQEAVLTDQLSLGTPNSNAGYIGWGTTAAAGLSLRLGGHQPVIGGSVDEVLVNCAYNGVDLNKGGCTFKMGDMEGGGHASANLATCDGSLMGVINVDGNTTITNQGTGAVMCINEVDNTTYTQAWRSVIDMYASQYVSASGTTVTSASPTYVDVAGTWTKGKVNGFAHSTATLTANAASGGRYHVTWDIAFSGTNGNDYMFVISNGGSNEAACASERTLSSSNIGSMGANCIIDIADSAAVVLRVTRTSGGTSNITIEEGNLVLRRM